MWLKIKSILLVHSVLSIVISAIVIIGIGGVSYIAIQKGNSLDSKQENTPGSLSSCIDLVKIGAVAVEKDPAGDTEAWLRFDYSNSADRSLNCKYTIIFYDSQQEAIRTIKDVEDTFESPSGQIHNGYSSTPYQAGMTARVDVR